MPNWQYDMATNSNEHFYSDLKPNKKKLSDLFEKQKLFHHVPENWHVIITDIVGSTDAVFTGRHENVNLIATGSIVTVLNIAYGEDIIIPFFFGGDGATFLVPPTLIDKLMAALALFKANTFENFNLELRTGTVSVATIYEAGHEIRIAKFKSSISFSIPIVLGNGLNYAEQLIKGRDALLSDHETSEFELDLSGMQCRWDKIPPPINKDEIVTLLVVATDISKQAAAFKKTLRTVDDLYGTPENRQPISVEKLKLKSTFSKLGAEMRVRLGRIKWFELLKTWLVTLYGYIYFRTQKGKHYLEKLVEMSDTLVIDGKINTVISGTAAHRKSLQILLDEMESAGEIYYGIHISSASIMSCYVRNLDDAHIHFVDGSEGGYTQAAKMLKAKLHP